MKGLDLLKSQLKFQENYPPVRSDDFTSLEEWLGKSLFKAVPPLHPVFRKIGIALSVNYIFYFLLWMMPLPHTYFVVACLALTSLIPGSLYVWRSGLPKSFNFKYVIDSVFALAIASVALMIHVGFIAIGFLTLYKFWAATYTADRGPEIHEAASSEIEGLPDDMPSENSIRIKGWLLTFAASACPFLLAVLMMSDSPLASENTAWITTLGMLYAVLYAPIPIGIGLIYYGFKKHQDWPWIGYIVGVLIYTIIGSIIFMILCDVILGKLPRGFF